MNLDYGAHSDIFPLFEVKELPVLIPDLLEALCLVGSGDNGFAVVFLLVRLVALVVLVDIFYHAQANNEAKREEKDREASRVGDKREAFHYT